MTLKLMQNAIRVSIAAAVFATCLIAAGANAQFGPAVFAGKFTLPYEVHWGGSVLSAGEYSIRMESVQHAAVVSSPDGKVNMFIRIPTVGDAEKGGATYLTIFIRGNERTVQSLNLPELGKMLTYHPLTKSEREELAKAGQVQTLSITTAKK